MKLTFAALTLAGTLTSTAMAQNYTQLVKDIYPGTTSSYPIGLTLYNDKVYFSATSDGTGVELYVSDGTSAGTMMLSDINPGSGSSNPTDFTVFDDKLFFRANDGTNGSELWVSDGSAAGTTLFMDISEGATSSNPSDFVVLGDVMLFEATTEEFGKELWVTDGTVDGTMILMDIQEGAAGSNPEIRSEYIVGTTSPYLVFLADDGVSGLSLYSTDGTAEGTVLLKNVTTSDPTDTPIISRPRDASVSGIYFAVGSELWITDGTEAGTTLIQEGVNIGGPSRISSYTLGGSTLFFGSSTGSSADNLWSTDGTTSGTYQIVTGLKSAEIARATTAAFGLGFGPVIGDKISLITDHGVGVNVWVTDGETIDLLIEGSIDWVLDVKLSMTGEQAVFFLRNGTALDVWVSDYTELNTVYVASFPGGVSTSVGESVPLNDMEALFSANSDAYGVELFKMEFPEIVVLPPPTSAPVAPVTPTSSPVAPVSPPEVPDFGSSASTLSTLASVALMSVVGVMTFYF